MPAPAPRSASATAFLAALATFASSAGATTLGPGSEGIRTIVSSSSSSSPFASVSQYVDTTIGSGGLGFGYGSVGPGAQIPFGAYRVGPDTTFVLPTLDVELWLPFQHYSGSWPNDTHVRAFSHTRMVGAGLGDLGNFGVMPVRNLTAATILHSAASPAFRSAFSHATETAVPGYYAVHLDDPRVRAELTASGTHSGVHRYTPDPATLPAEPLTLLLDVCHSNDEHGEAACPWANVSVALSPSDSSVVVWTGSLRMSGGLTGRSPSGGVMVYFYGEVSVVAPAETRGEGEREVPVGNRGGSSVVSPTALGLWANNSLHPSSPPSAPASATGTSGNLGAYVTYGAGTLPAGSALLLRSAISFVDGQHARDNLYAQQKPGGNASAPWPTFEAVRAQAAAEWESLLSRTAVQLPADTSPTNAAANLTVFYSTLYRSFLAPTTYSEHDGSFLGMDGRVHAVGDANSTFVNGADGAVYVSDLSLWDVHRTQIPLLSLVVPELSLSVAASLVTMDQQGGHLPRWPLANVYTGCMDGSHGIVAISDAVSKCVPGIASPSRPGFLSALFAAVRGAIEVQDAGSYTALGYVPSEESDTAASSTLEYAFDDGIASVLAGLVNETALQATWANRSLFFANTWSGPDMLACPRSREGNISCPLPFIPYPFGTTYVEGDAWQWRWFVPHNLTGLAGLFPDAPSFLDAHWDFFANTTAWPFVTGHANDWLANAWYWAGNEPDLLAVWEVVGTGNPADVWRVQFWSRALLETYYAPAWDGLPGNDDYGTMSAWAAFTALGLYPLAGTDQYILGSPLFAQANVTLASSLALSIVAHNASAANIYVAGAHVNGKPLLTPFVRHGDLVPSSAQSCAYGLEEGKGRGKVAAEATASAGLLEFFMTDVPTVWNSALPAEVSERERADMDRVRAGLGGKRGGREQAPPTVAAALGGAGGELAVEVEALLHVLQGARGAEVEGAALRAGLRLDQEVFAPARARKSKPTTRKRRE
jgi:predicted alpha-1,2-mannosidase